MNYKEIATYIVIILVGIVAAQHLNVVVSGSMEPVMYRGDIVIIDQNPSSIQVGDIVVYKATWVNENVIHRVKEIRTMSNGTKYLITKGDNNSVPDPAPVYSDQIVSKVVDYPWSSPIILPKIGYISIWSKELIGQNI